VIEHYRASIEKLAQEYAQSLKYCTITPALEASIKRDAAAIPDYDRELGPQTAMEPYRRKLSFMWKRLGALLSASNTPEANGKHHDTPADREISYSHSSELLADLELLQASLQADGEHEVTQGRLTTLIRQVQMPSRIVCKGEPSQRGSSLLKKAKVEAVAENPMANRERKW